MDEKTINDVYFSYLALDISEEQFVQEVTSIIERSNNEWIIGKLDAELRENMEIMKQLSTDDAVGDKDNAKKTVQMISRKLGILRQMIDSYNDSMNLGEELEKIPGTVKLVFARNSAGNTMIEKSLSEIEKYGDEKYGNTLALIERVANGDTDFNCEKQRHLTSSAKLKGIYEMKGFQIRLIYMRELDYVVIIGAYVKKDDNSLRYKDSLVNMKKQSEGYRREIRNGELDMEEELKIASEYYEKLMAAKGKGL